MMLVKSIPPKCKPSIAYEHIGGVSVVIFDSKGFERWLAMETVKSTDDGDNYVVCEKLADEHTTMARFIW